MEDVEEDSCRAVRHCWTSKDADSEHSAPELPRTFPDASGSKSYIYWESKTLTQAYFILLLFTLSGFAVIELGGAFFACFLPHNNLKVYSNPALSKSDSESDSCWVVPDSMQPYGLQPTRLLCPCNSPDKNTRVGWHSLLQGIFPTQGSNPRSPTLQADSLPSEPPGKPLEQVYQHRFPICEFIYPLEQPHKELISWFTADISEAHLREGLWLLQRHAASSCQWSNSNPQLWIPDATHHPSLDSSFWVEDGQVQKTTSQETQTSWTARKERNQTRHKPGPCLNNKKFGQWRNHPQDVCEAELIYIHCQHLCLPFFIGSCLWVHRVCSHTNPTLIIN